MSQTPDQSREVGVRLPESYMQIIPEHAPGIIGLIGGLSNPLEIARAILNSPEMAMLIHEDKITVGMIKPGLKDHFDTQKAGISFSTDKDITSYLVDDLLSKNDQIRPLFSVTIQFDDQMLEEFYGVDPDNKQDLKSSPMYRMKNIIIDQQSGRTQWDSFREMMLMGPSTFLIMGAKNGQARELWRKEIGPSWDVNKSQPGELRNLAISNKCNVWHGSSSENAVLYELGIVADQVAKMIAI